MPAFRVGNSPATFCLSHLFPSPAPSSPLALEVDATLRPLVIGFFLRGTCFSVFSCLWPCYSSPTSGGGLEKSCRYYQHSCFCPKSLGFWELEVFDSKLLIVFSKSHFLGLLKYLFTGEIHSPIERTSLLYYILTLIPPTLSSLSSCRLWQKLGVSQCWEKEWIQCLCSSINEGSLCGNRLNLEI